MLDSVKKQVGKIYRKKPVFMTLNVSGLIVAVLGILICLTLIGGIFIADRQIDIQTRSFERVLYDHLDITNEALNTLYSRVDGFQTIEDVNIAVNELVDENLEKLENIRAGVEVLNFRGGFDATLNKIDEVSTFLENIKKVPATLLEVKQTVKDKINLAVDKVAEVERRINSTGGTIRGVSNYAVFATILLALIFIVGQSVLFGKCRKNISNRKSILTV